MQTAIWQEKKTGRGEVKKKFLFQCFFTQDHLLRIRKHEDHTLVHAWKNQKHHRQPDFSPPSRKVFHKQRPLLINPVNPLSVKVMHRERRGKTACPNIPKNPRKWGVFLYFYQTKTRHLRYDMHNSVSQGNAETGLGKSRLRLVNPKQPKPVLILTPMKWVRGGMRESVCGDISFAPYLPDWSTAFQIFFKNRHGGQEKNTPIRLGQTAKGKSFRDFVERRNFFLGKKRQLQ